ncbi:MAG: hypothetical protein WDM87_05990 [Terracidiphilus sp.]
MPPLTKKLSDRTAIQRVLRVYLFILMSLLLIGGVTFTLTTFHKVFYRFGWDDDEGAVWWEAAHVTNLREMYHPIQQYPYFVVPYPPVYHAVTWLAAKGTGELSDRGSARLCCLHFRHQPAYRAYRFACGHHKKYLFASEEVALSSPHCFAFD